jgi:rubrerythrin
MDSRYTFDIKLPTDVNYSDAVEKAIKMEEKIQKFYLDSAEMSKSLLADIPRLFERIAKGRDKRKLQLEGIYN